MYKVLTRKNLKTPKFIQNKRAIKNVKNHNEMCFKWAILSAIHTPEAQNPQELYHYYQYCNELNFDGINFPVHVNQIDKFTQQNRFIILFETI